MNELGYDFLFLMENEISFVTGAVKNMLEDDHYTTEVVDLAVFSVDRLKSFAPIIISDVEPLLSNSKERVYLYDKCIELGVFLVLIGEPKDLESLMEVTSKTLVAEQFIRPINAKDTAKRLEELYEFIKSKDRHKKIMVVDDSPTFLRTAVEWLGDEYNVELCPSVSVALRKIANEIPDLILLDYEMPVVSGVQFLEMLHSEEETSEIPVIFLTSKSDKDTVSKVLSMNPQGYLLKTQPKEVILKYIQKFFYKETFK
ncbi:MAG: response regulator [Butyrivibrio sp.]|nr:response regulator [Butyrivibrio sp.]